MGIASKYLLSDEVKDQLRAHGLAVTLNHERDFKGVRHDVDTVWVGVDVLGVPNINHPKLLVSTFERYCKTVLKLPDTKELIWCPVFKTNLDNPNFVAGDINAVHDGEMSGFIYIETETAHERYGDDKTLAQLEGLVKQQFNDELYYYSVSLNNDPYLLTLKSHNGVCVQSMVCFDVDDQINRSAYTLMDRVLDEMLTMSDTVKFELDVNTEKFKNLTALEIGCYFTKTFADLFDVTPLIGGITYDATRKEFQGFMSLASLPDFYDLNEHKVKFFEIADEIGGFNAWSIRQVWHEKTPYSEWDRGVIAIFFETVAHCMDALEYSDIDTNMSHWAKKRKLNK